jgi:superfamily II DNA/RNA helicase
LQKRTIPQLKDLLRERQLPVSGKKQELIDRLMESHHEEPLENAEDLIEEVAESMTVVVEPSSTTTSMTLPSTSFEDLGIHPSVLPAIRAQAGWNEPTPVQQLAIPKLLLKEDQDGNSSASPDAFWCEAPTGSGKTAAYAIPLLQNLLMRRRDIHKQRLDKPERISALILAPTRELAVQIGNVVKQLSRNISIKNQQTLQAMVVHGGVPYEPQLAALADYARYGQTLDVMVATPGRLVDILTYYDDENSAQDAAMEHRLMKAFDEHGDDVSLEQLRSLGLDEISELHQDNSSIDGRNALNSMLDGLQYLILDEADRLLGNGFQDELNRLMELLPRADDKPEEDDSQESNGIPSIWMFSATFPKTIEPRLDQVLSRLGATKTPVRVQCSNSDRLLSDEIPMSASLKKKLARSTTVASANNYQTIGGASTIQLRTFRLEKPARTQALRKLLEEDYKDDWDRVLVFVATRYASEHVARKLKRAGIKSSELHGKLDQDARMRRLDDLKKGKIRVLLCTDVAARGIDISGLAAVVNYDLPRSTSDFVHRIGRTGRAGKEGMAVTFVTPADEAHMDLIEQRHLVDPTEREILEGFEPNEERWSVQAKGSIMSTPGAIHSTKGLVHDKMFGGIKGRRKSKKDRLREEAAQAATVER